MAPYRAQTQALRPRLGNHNRVWPGSHLIAQLSADICLLPQVVAPYRAQTYALRRKLVNSNALDRARLINSYMQVGPAHTFATSRHGCYVVPT